jgi:hypothetical protein
MYTRAIGRIGAAVMLVAAAGCGGARYYPVDGEVVYPDGSPATGLAGSTVVMESADQKVSAQGTVDDSGHFMMTTQKPGDGVVPGKQKVMISRGGNNPEKPNPRVIAEKYEDTRTSGLEVDVEPKANHVKLTVERTKMK